MEPWRLTPAWDIWRKRDAKADSVGGVSLAIDTFAQNTSVEVVSALAKPLSSPVRLLLAPSGLLSPTERWKPEEIRSALMVGCRIWPAWLFPQGKWRRGKNLVSSLQQPDIIDSTRAVDERLSWVISTLLGDLNQCRLASLLFVLTFRRLQQRPLPTRIVEFRGLPVEWCEEN